MGAELFDKILRERIYESVFWKEHLALPLDAESVLDVAVRLDCIGGVHGLGAPRPTAFLAILLKLCILEPAPAVVAEYIAQRHFKYLEALAMAYVRLAAPPAIIHAVLEARLGDWRRLRMQLPDGRFVLSWMDAFADSLISEPRVLSVLPAQRLPERSQSYAIPHDSAWMPLALDLLGDRVKSAPFTLPPRPSFGVSLDFDDAPDTDECQLKEDYAGDRAFCPESPGDNSNDEGPLRAFGGETVESLSVDETNLLRAQLGLPPLS